MIERNFVSHGVQIGLSFECAALLDALEHDPEGLHLPFGWRAVEDPEPDAPVSVRTSFFQTYLVSRRRRHTACMPERILWLSCGARRIRWALAAHAEFFVAERAPDHLFVHAGVVGWEGRAIVMPGSSFAGKTTLVQAWLEAGATYYSDEFAVFDRAGRVHPFARPLAIRDSPAALTRRVPVSALGAKSGTTPLPVGLVLVSSYRLDARWRPRRLTAARTLLALMRHTVAARGTPAHSMPILKQAVSGTTALAGVRGEARALVSAVLRRLQTPTLWAPPQRKTT